MKPYLGRLELFTSWARIAVHAHTNAWHECRLDVRGDHLEVFWDSQRVIDHHDGTFAGEGRAGMWTKADSITYFDDLKVEPLQRLPIPKASSPVVKH